MKENKIVMLYRCETPLHVGSGDEMGIVDLPIQREKHTGFPKMEASGIKGVFRDYFEKKIEENKVNKNDIKSLFGSNEESDNEAEKAEAGGLIFTDARLLLFPVKAGKDVFRWITCPYVLQRFARELGRIGKQDEESSVEAILRHSNLYEKLEDGTVYIIQENVKDQKKIQLDEFEFHGERLEDKEANNFLSIVKQIIQHEYLKNKLEKGVVLVSDEIFSYFTEMGTQVDTRIRIGENGVVVGGALFTEESLPEESILYSIVEEWKKGTLQEFTKVLEAENFFMQFGGDMTIGKGITQVCLYKKV